MALFVNATTSSLSSGAPANATCEELRNWDLELQRSEMLEAARLSSEQWASTSWAVSAVSLALDIVLMLLIIRLRRYRALQRAGVGYLCCVLVGCIFGHVASLMDGLPLSGAVCRGKLAVIYLFLYGLLAPLLGKLVSLCRAAGNVLLAGTSTGWDLTAQRFAACVLALQLLAVVCYLGLTAGKPTREDRLQTVCSEMLSEHAFHLVDGLLTAGLLVVAFGMIAWLQVCTPMNSPPKIALTVPL